MNIIEVKNLSKTYRVQKKNSGLRGIVKSFINPENYEHRAVDNISFKVKKGDFLAFIGPNGSGKSTTIKMLTGVLQPTFGSISVMGEIPCKKREKLAMDIGVVFGQRTQLWWNLPLVESYELIKNIYKISEQDYQNNLDYFDKLLNIKDFLNKPVRQLSLGQRMQCELVAAMLHDPKIIYLDEPTIGVDIVAKEKIRNFLLQVNKNQGTTILLTTHDIQDIETLATDIIIINDGNIVFDGEKAALKKYYNQEKILIIEFENKVTDNFSLSEKLIKDDGYIKHFLVDGNVSTSLSFINKIAARYPIKDLTFKDIGIEETIMNIYNH